MKKIFFLYLILTVGSFTTVGAQNKIASNHSIGINLLGVEYSYEQSLGGLFSLNSSAGIGSNIILNSGNRTYFDISPYISVAPRYYYNMNRRLSKSLNTFSNSANYITINGSYTFKPIAQNMDIDYESRFGITPAWGIRRVYNQKWLLDFNLGINVLFNRNDRYSLGPSANLKFGYVF